LIVLLLCTVYSIIKQQFVLILVVCFLRNLFILCFLLYQCWREEF